MERLFQEYFEWKCKIQPETTFQHAYKFKNISNHLIYSGKLNNMNMKFIKQVQMKCKKFKDKSEKILHTSQNLSNQQTD